MSQPVDYIHYLRYWDGAAYQYWYDNAGTVSYTATPTALDYAPEGWQEYEIILERGFTYYGTFTSFTTPLKFVKDAALILRHLKYTFGIEAKAELYVKKLRRSDYTYQDFFTGALDMSKTQDEWDSIVVPVIEGGFLAKLRAKENTPFTYDLQNGSDIQWIEHDGIELQARLSWTGIQNEVLSDYYPTLAYYDTEGTNLVIRPKNQDLTSLPYIAFAEVGAETPIGLSRLVIKYNLNVYIEPSPTGGDGKLRIILNGYDNVSGASTFETVLFTGGLQSHGTSQTYVGEITHDFTQNANEHMTIRYVLWKNTGGTSNNYLVSQYDITSIKTEVSLKIINRFETTYIPTIKASKVFEYLIASINDDATTLPTSTTILLDGDHYLTSGDGLRNLTNSRFVINFAEFFKWVNCKFGASFYYDRVTNICYLEAKENVFVDAVNPDFPSRVSVTNFKCLPFIEEAATNFKIGSGQYEYDARKNDDYEITNGKDEFNTLHEYLTPLKTLSGTIKDYTSSIRDDIHGIEQVRINLDGKELADASSDNEVYALHCDSTVTGSYTPIFSPTSVTTYALYRKPIDLTPGANYWEVDNIFSPETAYNFAYSPVRCILNNGNYFRSLYKLNDADDFKIQFTAKSNPLGLRMITHEGATPTDIYEGNDIGIQSLCANDDVLFLPFIFEITIREDVNMYQALQDYPFNFITFTFDGNDYSGYILKAVSKPTFRGETQLRLLCHRDTDITNLIRTH
jgi:hypothetical protein